MSDFLQEYFTPNGRRIQIEAAPAEFTPDHKPIWRIRIDDRLVGEIPRYDNEVHADVFRRADEFLHADPPEFL